MNSRLGARYSLKYPLKNIIFEKIRSSGNVIDTDLLNELGKSNSKPTMAMLNKILLQLEIAGVIAVRWIGKDKRRIEYAKAPERVEVENAQV
jgi:hypothetical protein